MRLRHRVLALTVVAILLLVTSLTYPANAQLSPARVFVLVIEDLTWEQLLAPEYPGLNNLVRSSFAGLMNTRTAGVTNGENAAVTLGASSRGLGTSSSHLAFDADTILLREPSENSVDYVPILSKPEALTTGVSASTIFRRRTGMEPEARILHLDISQIQARNQGLSYTVVPGALGSTLENAGVPVTYIGNGDTLGPRRHLMTAFMDERGVIPHGTVETPVLFDERFPFGVRGDYDALWRQVQSASQEQGVIVVELSDLNRLSEARSLYQDVELRSLEPIVVSQMQKFIDRLKATLTKDDYLMVLVPTPPSTQISRGDSFSPLLIWNQSAKGGLLASSTTRRPGIVTNLDVAPTILHLMGIPAPSVMYGRPAVQLPDEQPIEYLMRVRHQTVATNVQRKSILKPLVYTTIGLYLAATVFILVKEMPNWIGTLICIGLPFIMAMPLALLVLPLFGPLEPSAALSLALALSGVISSAAYGLGKRSVRTVTLLSLVTAFVVLADTLLGNALVKRSILGYDPMGGARFYGIGNEYMGVLIGASIIGAAPLLDLFPKQRRLLKVVIPLVFALCTAAISLPTLGANVGGALTASIGFGLTVLLLYDVKISYKTAVLLAAIPVAVVGVNTYFDKLSSTGSSHLGQAISLIGSRGLVEVYSIITRKLTMNLKLFKYSVWSKALLVALGVIAWFLYHPPTLIRKIKDRYPYLIKGLIGATTAAIAALMFNDSGVVAGALVLNFTTSIVLFLGIRLTLGKTLD